MKFFKSLFKTGPPSYKKSQKMQPLLFEYKNKNDGPPTYEQTMAEDRRKKRKKEKRRQILQMIENALIDKIESGGNVDWYDISLTPNLSEYFIRRYKDKVCWHDIKKTQNLSIEFKKEFSHILLKIKT